MKTETQIVPYGEIVSSLPLPRFKALGQRTRISKSLNKIPRECTSVLVAFSRDLDESFVELFREKATQRTKLLILNEGTSTDTLLSLVMELPVRTPERLYVLDSGCASGKTRFTVFFLSSLLQRLASGLEADETDERILDARIEKGILRVISPKFERLDIPIADITLIKAASSSKINKFEIDEDGAFIYWPELDVHLGWRELHQLINPEAALKASQKSDQFNTRYGKAVQLLREKTGLARSGISGISEKQLGRVEKGECRLTSNAIENLAKAHRLSPNDYMRELAKALKAEASSR